MFNLKTYFPHRWASWASSKPPKSVYIVEIICKLLWVSTKKRSLKNRKRSGKSQGKVREFHCHGSVGTLDKGKYLLSEIIFCSLFSDNCRWPWSIWGDWINSWSIRSDHNIAKTDFMYSFISTCGLKNLFPNSIINGLLIKLCRDVFLLILLTISLYRWLSARLQ